MSYQKLLGKLQAKECKPSVPMIGPGDLLKVGVLIQEGNKSRVQPFQGTVLGIHSNQASTTITLRRLAQIVNVERVLLIHSAKVATIQVLRRYKVRRSKLYYLRLSILKRIVLNKSYHKMLSILRYCLKKRMHPWLNGESAQLIIGDLAGSTPAGCSPP